MVPYYRDLHVIKGLILRNYIGMVVDSQTVITMEAISVYHHIISFFTFFIKNEILQLSQFIAKVLGVCSGRLGRGRGRLGQRLDHKPWVHITPTCQYHPLLRA